MIIKICTYVMLLIHVGLMLSPWSWLKFRRPLMWIASLILLLCQMLSFSMTVLPCQLILWCSSSQCCATADF